MRIPIRQVRMECPAGAPSVRSSAHESAESTSDRLIRPWAASCCEMRLGRRWATTSVTGNSSVRLSIVTRETTEDGRRFDDSGDVLRWCLYGPCTADQQPLLLINYGTR